MAKRISVLAKELGLDSKIVVEKVKETGEFVKNASAVINPWVEKAAIELLQPIIKELEAKKAKAQKKQTPDLDPSKIEASVTATTQNENATESLQGKLDKNTQSASVAPEAQKGVQENKKQQTAKADESTKQIDEELQSQGQQPSTLQQTSETVQDSTEKSTNQSGKTGQQTTSQQATSQQAISQQATTQISEIEQQPLVQQSSEQAGKTDKKLAGQASDAQGQSQGQQPATEQLANKQPVTQQQETEQQQVTEPAPSLENIPTPSLIQQNIIKNKIEKDNRGRGNNPFNSRGRFSNSGSGDRWQRGDGSNGGYRNNSQDSSGSGAGSGPRFGRGSGQYQGQYQGSRFQQGQRGPQSSQGQQDVNSKNQSQQQNGANKGANSNQTGAQGQQRPGGFQTPKFANAPGNFRSRGGGAGRNQTAGAFGKGSTKASAKAVKRMEAKTRRQEQDQQMHKFGAINVPKGEGEIIRLRKGATLSDFAEIVHTNPATLVATLFKLGEMVTATQNLDEETLQMLGLELNYVIEFISPEDEDKELLEEFDIQLMDKVSDAIELAPDSEIKTRPPVVTIMGHVDHGKTKLLDAIRNSNVIDSEAGGITQHIGAYQVHTKVDGEERFISFIDTPGHEAFTEMRARGAKVTDIAVLVVAANDGVMPQTIEALNHAIAAGVPIVVAINKIDLDGANPGKIKTALTEYGLVAEEYGGNTMFVEVSAKNKTNIDKLLEAIILTADASLELKANWNTLARGITLEARLDKGRGSVVTVLVQNGVLKNSDPIVVGAAYGKARAMFDEHGNAVQEAFPSQAVQVIGLDAAPHAGDLFLGLDDVTIARQIAQKRHANYRAAKLAKTKKRVTLENINDEIEKGKLDRLNLIIKGDAAGSVESLENSIMKIDLSGTEIAIDIIHRGVGDVTQNDVNLAGADGAVIIGFNVGMAQKVDADQDGVDVRFYSVVYDVLDDITAAVEGMLKPDEQEQETGTALVQDIFKSSRAGNIAGCIVKQGTITRNSKARVVRDNKVIANGLIIDSLKRFKDDATTVKEGFECGIGLGSYNDIRVDDSIICYEIIEIKKTLKEVQNQAKVEPKKNIEPK